MPVLYPLLAVGGMESQRLADLDKLAVGKRRWKIDPKALGAGKFPPLSSLRTARSFWKAGLALGTPRTEILKI